MWLWFVAASVARGDTGACADYGKVKPSEVTLFVAAEPFVFRVEGGSACGDLTTCEWWAEDDRGSFDVTTGSPVSYTPPVNLDNCVDITYRVFVSCDDAGTTEWSEVTLRCTDAQRQQVQDALDEATSVSGGGCGSAGFGFVMLPLLGLGRFRARGCRALESAV